METGIFWFIILIYILINALNFLTSYLNHRAANREIPSNVSDVYDEETYADWRRYHHDLMRFKNGVSFIRFVVVLIFLASGLLRFIANYTLELSESMLVSTLLFIGILYLLNLVPSIITSYLYTFTIEEKHGFNKTTNPLFIKDEALKVLLTVLFGGGLISLVVVLYDLMGSAFITLASITVFSIILLINLGYVKVLLPLFNTLTPLEDSPLKTQIEALAQKANYKVNKIHVMDASKRSTKLNAFFSGFGSFKNVVLFDTLVENMDDPEILAVLAHEIGHAKHKDVLKNLAMSASHLLVTFGLLYGFFTLDIFYEAFGLEQFHFGFMLILFGIAFMPLNVVLGILVNAISRKAEYKADAYAKAMTSRDSMIGALKKLARQNFSNLTPHALQVTLEYSHPPMHKRIEALEE